jgi:GT2 family glycosyltransferase
MLPAPRPRHPWLRWCRPPRGASFHRAMVRISPDRPEPALGAPPPRPSGPVPTIAVHDRSVAEPEISVVIPTRERAKSLARCLAALEAQTACDALEVVVVDDAGREAGAVKNAIGQPPGCRMVRGPGRGAAAARNLGAAASRAPLVLFTDDDCEPEPGWAESLATALQGGVAAAAGSTVTNSGRDSLAVASQEVADYLTKSSLDRAGRTRFAASSNLGCRAEVLDKIPFDEDYPGSGGEDRDWCARLIEAGHELVLVPDARVDHHQRLTLGGFWRKHAAYGRGAWMFHRRHGFPDAKAPGFHAGLVHDAFRRAPAVGALVCVAQVATAAGFARQAVSEGRNALP